MKKNIGYECLKIIDEGAQKIPPTLERIVVCIFRLSQVYETQDIIHFTEQFFQEMSRRHCLSC